MLAGTTEREGLRGRLHTRALLALGLYIDPSNPHGHTTISISLVISFLHTGKLRLKEFNLLLLVSNGAEIWRQAHLTLESVLPS